MLWHVWGHSFANAIDTQKTKAERNNMISKLITFRLTKAKVKANSVRLEFTLNWL